MWPEDDAYGANAHGRNATRERPSNLPHKPAGELQALGLPADSRAVDPMVLRKGRIVGVALKMLRGRRTLRRHFHPLGNLRRSARAAGT